MKKMIRTILVFVFCVSVLGLQAQTPYNPFTQNIHFEPEPSVQGFSCGSSPLVAFTQGIITSDSALLYSTQPLVVKICISGFVFLPSTPPANLVLGSYASNFSWSFDPFNANCLVGTQNTALPGVGNDPLNPDVNSSGDIKVKLHVPSTLTTITPLSVNVNLEIPTYMQATNIVTDDIESTTTQSFCSPTSLCEEEPTLTIYPDNTFCFGDNVQLHAVGEIGADFDWITPVGCSATITTNANGTSDLIITNFQADCNGAFKVRQKKSSCTTWSNYSTIVLNSGVRPNIQFVTSSCINNTGEVQVNATTPLGALEFSINGGAFQNSAILNTAPGSAYYVTVRQAGTNCVAHYEGRCVHCTNASTCATPPKDSIVSPRLVCANLPINLSGYFQNASSATWSSSGTGSFSNTLISSSGTTVSYALSAADIANGYVNITLTTDDPDGAGPCMPGICVRHIRIINGLVSPSILDNSPLCLGNTLELTATGVPGAINWSGPNAFSSGSNPALVNNVSALNAGIYTATVSAYGCTDASADKSISFINPNNLNINVTPIDEYCAGQANGKILVDVSNGSGNYTTCFNNNISNCSTSANATFNYIAPGTYNVTVVDATCPNNTHSIPVTINPGQFVNPPVISSTYTVCDGDVLTLSGTVPAGYTIEWRKQDNTYVSTGTSVQINNASNLAAGNYFAKAISPIGCGSVSVPFTVVVNPKPVISALNVICNGSISELTVVASGTNLTYSTDGINFQASNVFTGLSAGYYVVTVSDANCSATQSIWIQNCACPNSPEITLVAPMVSCGINDIPLNASFTNAANATWTTTGSGIFNVSSGTSPLINLYSPSLADLAAGYVNLTITTDDPDGAGPCVAASELIHILLLDSLEKPIVNGPNVYCQGDTTAITTNSTLPSLHWYDFGTYSYYNDTMIMPDVNVFKSGYYVVEAYGNACVSKMDTFELVVNNMPNLNITKTITHESCFGNANGAIELDIQGGSNNYKVCYNIPASCFSGSSPIEMKWLTPGVYNLTITDLSCPNASMSMVENIQAGPIVSPPYTASSNSPVCEGGELILSTSGNGGQYIWNHKNNFYVDSGTTIIRTDAKIEMSGTYEVVRVVDGCASVPISTEVTVFDMPTINSIDTFCYGGESNGELVVNATADNPLEYSINNLLFQSSNTFSNLNNGLYLVQVRSAGSNCSVAEQVELYCECYCNKEAKIEIFPNPNSGSFKYEIALYDKVDDVIRVKLMDISGRVVYEKQSLIKGLHFSDEINISGLAKGTYFLKMKFADVERIEPVNIID